MIGLVFSSHFQAHDLILKKYLYHVLVCCLKDQKQTVSQGFLQSSKQKKNVKMQSLKDEVDYKRICSWDPSIFKKVILQQFGKQLHCQKKMKMQLICQAFSGVLLLISFVTAAIAQDASIVEQGLTSIANVESYITQSYPNWYAYDYDGSDGQSINDGGNDMFDGGNQISITAPDFSSSITYNQNYQFNGFEFQSQAQNPFVALLWVNDEQARRDVRIEVSGNIGADGSGSSNSITGSVQISDYYLHYKTFQTYASGNDPNILQVYFNVFNRNKWNSEVDTEGVDVTIGSDLQHINDVMLIRAGEGAKRNVMNGYTLLSRNPSSYITRQELETVLLLMLQALSIVPVSPTNVPVVIQGISAIGNVRTPIAASYSGWYNYNYDGSDGSSISDGGSDMFDTGNLVTISDVAFTTSVLYNSRYRFNDFEFQSQQADPFVWLLWVNNEPRRRSTSIQTTGNVGADGGGSTQQISGSIQSGNYWLSYQTFQIYEAASDPTILQAYFTIYNGNEWSSQFSSSYVTAYFRSTTHAVDEELVVEAGEGKLRNVLVGFTLLSRYSTSLVSNAEIETVMLRILQAISSVDITQTSSVVGQGLAAISSYRTSITQSYTGWYAYTYDGTDGASISDGGHDMFDEGNRISLTSYDESTLVEYNSFYSVNGLDFQSAAEHPFVSLMWVDNQATQRSISILISGNVGADGSGTTESISGSIQFGDYQLSYTTFQLYEGGSDPNILYAYFTIYNTIAWNSEISQQVAISINSDNQNIYDQLVVEAGEGRLRNAMVGFTLLSRNPTSHIAADELENVLMIILQATSTIDINPTDVDACLYERHNCHDNAACENTPGAFNCSCLSGYYGTGEVCSDIDECSAIINPCPEGASCSNTDGSFACTCTQGYRGDGLSCEDIDECSENLSDCGLSSTCTNEPGSYNCSCNSGYSGDGRTCTDIDECDENPSYCAEAAICANTEGSFTCTCASGFSGNGRTCQDIDECDEAFHSCGYNATCANQIGSYSCSCNSGYSGNGRTCRDIDECNESGNDCGENAVCVNTDGSFTCTCTNGFVGNGRVCTDKNECLENVHDCGVNSQCLNEEGSFVCSCNTGFRGDGYDCTDVNECFENLNDCGENALCRNTQGNYSCSCIEGFSGNGRTCVETYDVLCYAEYMVLKVHSYYYTSQGIDLEELHLSDMSCHGVEDPTSPDIWIFNTTTLSSCSTSLKENSTHLVYSNTINNVRTGGVYHGNPIYNTFSCVYEKEADVSLFSFSYGVVRNVKNITAPAGLGVFAAEMNVFTDHTYSTAETKTQYEATDTLYIMMNLGATHPDLTLVIDRCWITAAPDLDHESQYAFIENGCPVDENRNDVQITASGVGRSASFDSPVFAFIDYDTTYLHCSLEICSLAGGNTCQPICGIAKRSLSSIMKRGKRQTDLDENNSVTETLSVGPYFILRDETSEDSNESKASLLSNTSLIAILGAVVIVAVALLVFSGIWIKGRRNEVRTAKMDAVSFTNPAMMKE